MRFILASAILAIGAATSASADDHQVTVGANSSLTFNPTSVTAQANDTITFVFSPRNHTVTQSNFTAPCLSLEGGVDSGFEPVSSNTTEVVSFTITVNDTNPSWWYCRQMGHCKAGMVFAINPTTNQTFEKFQATANASSADGSPPSNSNSPSSTTAGHPSSTTSTTASKSSSSSSATNTGARVGGLLAAVGFVAGILF
ncbi:Cupredoxin [Lactarius tabidus]